MAFQPEAEVVGKLFLNTNNGVDAPTCLEGELIVVSTSLVSNKRRNPRHCYLCHDEDEMKQFEQEYAEEEERLTEFCNVLRIEWVDGIAYRKHRGV